MAVDLKVVVASLKIQFATTKAAIMDNDGWDLGDIKDVFEAVLLVVGTVETVGREMAPMTGAEKKAAAVELLNWLIDIPVAPEWLEEKFFSVGVDFAIIGLNRFVGPAWLDKLNLNLPQ